MNVPTQLLLNKAEVWGRATDIKGGGVRLRLDLAEWRGLGINEAKPVTLRRGAEDEYYWVERVTPVDALVLVTLATHRGGVPAAPPRPRVVQRPEAYIAPRSYP